MLAKDDLINRFFDTIRLKLDSFEKGFRLNTQQKQAVSDMFAEFVQYVTRLEQDVYVKERNNYILSDTMIRINRCKNFLYSKPASMFACFRCRRIVPLRKREEFTRPERNMTLHVCRRHDGAEPLLGEGIPTNWKTLYVFFFGAGDVRKQVFENGDINE